MRKIDSPSVILEQIHDLVLRRAGDHHEIISNGIFLMDTRDGRSERLLVSAALDRTTAERPTILIGGLGVGFTLAQAVSHPATGPITVIELRPEIIAWHRTHLRRHSQGALDDPRVRVLQADLLDHLTTTQERYDLICLDIDNGPDWTVTDSNNALYDTEGIDLLHDRLTPQGILTIWSANASATFHDRLTRRFTSVHTLEVPVPRGEPDLVYLAHKRA